MLMAATHSGPCAGSGRCASSVCNVDFTSAPHLLGELNGGLEANARGGPGDDDRLLAVEPLLADVELQYVGELGDVDVPGLGPCARLLQVLGAEAGCQEAGLGPCRPRGSSRNGQPLLHPAEVGRRGHERIGTHGRTENGRTSSNLARHLMPLPEEDSRRVLKRSHVLAQSSITGHSTL